MRKVISVALCATMALSLAACGGQKTNDIASDTSKPGTGETEIVEALPEVEETEPVIEQLAGGWAHSESCEITESQREMFDTAMKNLDGVSYAPMAYLGSQVVAGTKHCFLARAAVVVPDAEPYYALVFITEGLDGDISILDIENINLSDFCDYEYLTSHFIEVEVTPEEAEVEDADVVVEEVDEAVINAEATTGDTTDAEAEAEAIDTDADSDAVEAVEEEPEPITEVTADQVVEEVARWYLPDSLDVTEDKEALFNTADEQVLVDGYELCGYLGYQELDDGTNHCFLTRITYPNAEESVYTLVYVLADQEGNYVNTYPARIFDFGSLADYSGAMLPSEEAVETETGLVEDEIIELNAD